VGTNAGAIALPFQHWRRFKEAFAPELIDRAISETPGQVRHVVDPFGGSGTTALACQFLGVKPTTIEVNPYLADLIEAKLSFVDVDRAAAALGRVITQVNKGPDMAEPSFPGAPKTMVEPGVNGRFVFYRNVAARLLSFRNAIEAERDEAVRRLFRVVLASLSVSVSNVTVSGKGRRYRRAWEQKPARPELVDDEFRAGVLRVLYDIRLYGERRCREYNVLKGDARKLASQVGAHDLAVFSPPYPNSFDYTDVYNVELWSGGYLTSSHENLELRNSTLRSHVQILRDLTASGVSSKLLIATMERLDEVSGKLWNPHIPRMIGAYASDMAKVLGELAKQLRTGGRVYFVVGDSRYGGIDVPTASILAEIVPVLGLKVLHCEACRSMRSSPQQGGRPELPETLLVLQRP
jgi:hypothetical protein